MTSNFDSEEGPYIVNQPTADGAPNEVTIRIDDTIVTYSGLLGYKSKSRVHADQLLYEERSVQTVRTDVSEEDVDIVAAGYDGETVEETDYAVTD